MCSSGLEDRLSGIRRPLFERLDQIDTAWELLALQLDIAEAILDAERALWVETRSDSADETRFHIERLRLYGDTLAWRCLHPHTIRQLAKNPGRPPGLLAQGGAFVGVVKEASELYLETGLPVLVADITNVIKIGDIILVSHPEYPTIIECKTKASRLERLMQGRIGRQLSRAVRTAQYLEEGIARVSGEHRPLRAVETMHSSEHNWEAMERTCRQAMEHGEAFAELGAGDYLWALRPEHEDSVLAQAVEKCKSLRPFELGTSDGLMGHDDGLYPPPSAWPIPRDIRFELTEDNLRLLHCVSYAALAGDVGGERKIRIVDGDYPFIMSIRGEECSFSTRFVFNAVYEFETTDSCARGLLAVAEKATATLPVDRPDIPEGKPSVWYLESLEDFPSFFQRNSPKGTDYVAVPANEVGGRTQVQLTTGGVGERPAIMPVGALEKLIDHEE